METRCYWLVTSFQEQLTEMFAEIKSLKKISIAMDVGDCAKEPLRYRNR
ncbi:unnamed protein product [Haemonchus placei]|uniref:Transposase n=1 Tax=Haemonchus placei TaxID=6290 RepID=A0A0N4WLQ5_HAEPC|nr:unnamed protein product [Haemonchus placei]